MGTIKELIEDLKALGVKKGDKLMVHSSYKSLGNVENGIDGFITALIEAVGENGTVMLPTFSYDIVTDQNPTFDVRYTRSNVGIIPEIFRKTEGVKRSVHPTHSIAVWGKDKEAYIKDHWKDKYAVAENSPLFRLKDNGGKILMVGCGICHNTLIHGVEAYLQPPYAYNVDFSMPKFHRIFKCIDENDNIFLNEACLDFMYIYGYSQRYDRLQNIMDIKGGKLLAAESYIMDAGYTWDVVVKKMQEDPFYFVEYIDKPVPLY